jgi:hypothetical protein
MGSLSFQPTPTAEVAALNWQSEYIDLGLRKDGPIWREVAYFDDLRFDLEVGPGFWPIYIGRISKTVKFQRSIIKEQAFENAEAVRDWCEAFVAAELESV